jgi:hypothetical protein
VDPRRSGHQQPSSPRLSFATPYAPRRIPEAPRHPTPSCHFHNAHTSSAVAAFRHTPHALASSVFSPYHRAKTSTVSTGALHTLLRFHVPPIKLVVFQRSYLFPVGGLILRPVSRLDAFSGSPLLRSLLGCATGVTTDTRALSPSRSSRTRDRSSQTPSAHSG